VTLIPLHPAKISLQNAMILEVKLLVLSATQIPIWVDTM